MEAVVLLVAKGGHVPGQLIHARLNVLIVLYNADRLNPMPNPPSMKGDSPHSILGTSLTA